MTTNNVERCLWISAVIFVTYLLIGSFLVSKNIIELVYLVILYVTMISAKILSNKK